MKIFMASALLPVHAKHVQTLRIDHRSSNSIGSMIPHLLGSFGMSVWASAPKGRIGSDRIGSDRIDVQGVRTLGMPKTMRCTRLTHVPGRWLIKRRQNQAIHSTLVLSVSMLLLNCFFYKILVFFVLL
jgi:hypothetical protein